MQPQPQPQPTQSRSDTLQCPTPGPQRLQLCTRLICRCLLLRCPLLRRLHLLDRQLHLPLQAPPLRQRALAAEQLCVGHVQLQGWWGTQGVVSTGCTLCLYLSGTATVKQGEARWHRGTDRETGRQASSKLSCQAGSTANSCPLRAATQLPAPLTSACFLCHSCTSDFSCAA